MKGAGGGRKTRGKLALHPPTPRPDARTPAGQLPEPDSSGQAHGLAVSSAQSEAGNRRGAVDRDTLRGAEDARRAGRDLPRRIWRNMDENGPPRKRTRTSGRFPNEERAAFHAPAVPATPTSSCLNCFLKR